MNEVTPGDSAFLATSLSFMRESRSGKRLFPIGIVLGLEVARLSNEPPEALANQKSVPAVKQGWSRISPCLRNVQGARDDWVGTRSYTRRRLMERSPSLVPSRVSNRRFSGCDRQA